MTSDLAKYKHNITPAIIASIINTPTVPGRNVGIPDMMALQHIYLVNGQASMSGQLMCALVARAGHRVKVTWKKDDTAVAEAWRRDPWSRELEHVGTIEFSPLDAELAGLNEKGTYQQYPRVMMAWRAISQLCRIYFADTLMGIAYVPEEVDADNSIEPLPLDTIDVEMTPDAELENGAAIIEDVLEGEIVE